MTDGNEHKRRSEKRSEKSVHPEGDAEATNSPTFSKGGEVNVQVIDSREDNSRGHTMAGDTRPLGGHTTAGNKTARDMTAGNTTAGDRTAGNTTAGDWPGPGRIRSPKLV